jgi:hypothetical protein
MWLEEPASPRASRAAARDRVAIRLLLALIAAVGIGGIAASLAIAGDDSWTRLTLSQLSADPVAGPLFRSTIVAVGLCFLPLAWRLDHVVSALRDTGSLGRAWAREYRVGLWLMGPAFIATGVFALGVSPIIELIHGVAAYTAPIVVLVLMFSAPIAVPALRPRAGRATLGILAAILLAYGAAVIDLISYAAMELVAFALAGGWFAWFVDRLAGMAVAAALGTRGRA